MNNHITKEKIISIIVLAFFLIMLLVNAKNEELIYRYYDKNNDLQVELHFDKSAGSGYGTFHRYHYPERTEYVLEFTFDSIGEAQWEEPDPYDFDAIPISSHYLNETEEFEEIIAYTPDGRVDYYKTQGFVSFLRYENEKTKEPKDTIKEIDYVYRDDGTLFYKEYRHNPMIFEMGYHITYTYYDEAERIIYEHAHNTTMNGCNFYYYIYEDETNKPAYCLYLDNSSTGTYFIGEMTRFLP